MARRSFSKRRAWLAALVLTVAVFMPAAAAEFRQVGSLAGKILVSSEAMGDPRFNHTIIYMIEHDAGGAIGLVVNVPIADVPLAELLPRLGLEDKEARGHIGVFYGGPVGPGRSFVLHSTEVLPEGSVKVDNSIAVTTQPEVLRAIARGEGPRHSLFVLGYAGWAPGQLEGELARAAWFVIPGDTALIFADNPAQSWARAIARRSLDL
ncbi:MAG TPA: YqgE/AlgH family protein [Kiloniellales bacterium]